MKQYKVALQTFLLRNFLESLSKAIPSKILAGGKGGGGLLSGKSKSIFYFSSLLKGFIKLCLSILWLCTDSNAFNIYFSAIFAVKSKLCCIILIKKINAIKINPPPKSKFKDALILSSSHPIMLTTFLFVLLQIPTSFLVYSQPKSRIRLSANDVTR